LDFMAHTNRRPKMQARLVGEHPEAMRSGGMTTDYATKLAESFNYLDLFKFESLKRTSFFFVRGVGV